MVPLNDSVSLLISWQQTESLEFLPKCFKKSRPNPNGYVTFYLIFNVLFNLQHNEIRAGMSSRQSQILFKDAVTVTSWAFSTKACRDTNSPTGCEVTACHFTESSALTNRWHLQKPGRARPFFYLCARQNLLTVCVPITNFRTGNNSNSFYFFSDAQKKFFL